MKPIMQKNRHNKETGIIGDCLRACICSILEISDESVPNFVEDIDYPTILLQFLKDRNLIMRHSLEEPMDVEYYMVWGLSPRKISHSVVYRKGKLIHDPHPDGGGVIPDRYVWLEDRD